MTAPIHLSAEATSVPLRGLLAAEEAPAGRRPEALGAGGPPTWPGQFCSEPVEQGEPPPQPRWAWVLPAGQRRTFSPSPRVPAGPFQIRPAVEPAVKSTRPLTLRVHGLESLGGQRRRPRPRWRTQRLPLQWLQPPEPSGCSAAGLPAPVGTSHPPHSGPLQSQGPASRKPGHRREDGHPRRAWGRAPGPRHPWSVTSSQTPRRPPWSQRRLTPTVPSRGGGSGRPSAPASLVQTAEFQRRSASLKF